MTTSLRPNRPELNEALNRASVHADHTSSVDYESVLAGLASDFFAEECENPFLGVQTFAWLEAHESQTPGCNIEAFAASDRGRVVEGLTSFLASWGREPVAGMSTADIATAVMCLIEGMAVRWSVDSDSVCPKFAGTASTALIKAFTQPAADASAVVDLRD